MKTDEKKTSCCSRCCRTFIANWILWLLILVAIAGIVLAVLFALKPCKEELVTTDLTAPMDVILMIDNSGSVNNDQFADQITGLKAFLTALSANYTGELFRGAALQFSSAGNEEITHGLMMCAPLETTTTANTCDSLLTQNDCDTSSECEWRDRLATELVEVLDDTRLLIGGTDFVSAFQLAESHFNESTPQGTFKLGIIVSDGASSSPTDSIAASNELKDSNVTVVGLIVGTTSPLELYTVTSCTDRPTTVIASEDEMNATCPFFAEVTDFATLSQQAADLASQIEFPVESTTSSICVSGEYFAFLALLLPLLLFCFGAPLWYCLKSKFCPGLGSSEVKAAGGIAGAAAAGTGSKWGTVQAGGYLWNMSERGGVQHVNFGKGGAPPSAPQAELSPAQAAENFANYVYGGGKVTVRSSRYLCFCCWACLDDDDRDALEKRSASAV
jgi:hypothetical protein